jgi:hypothetical protein
MDGSFPQWTTHSGLTSTFHRTMKFRPLCFDYHAEATSLLQEAREPMPTIWIFTPPADDVRSHLADDNEQEDEEKEEEGEVLDTVTTECDVSMPMSRTFKNQSSNSKSQKRDKEEGFSFLKEDSSDDMDMEFLQCTNEAETMHPSKDESETIPLVSVLSFQ